MVSGLASPPPSLGGFGLGGLQLPKPPPGLGGKALSGVGAGLKGAGAGVVRLGGGAVAGFAIDALFPKSTASSALSELPEDFFNQGNGQEIEKPRQNYEPRMYGSQGNTYTINVNILRTNNDTGESTTQTRGSYVSYGSFGVTVEKTGSGGTIVYIHRSMLSGALTITTVTTAGSNTTLKVLNLEVFTNTDDNYQPPNNYVNEPKQLEPSSGIRSVGGISGNTGGWTPPPSAWGAGYGGASSGSFNGSDPIAPPPSVGGGNLSPTTTSSPTNAGNNTASGSGTQSGTQSGTSAGSGSASVGGSGAGGSGGIVGGGVIGGGTTTSGEGTISGGGTETGTGLGTESPSQTEVSSPSNTGNNTASAPPTIPILNPTGTEEGSISPIPQEDIKPGTLPFPPGTGIDTTKPGDITIQDPIKGPITKTPDEVPEPEEEKKPEERIIPIPFNFDFDRCCAETKDNLDDLREDLQCVIDKICGEGEPEFWEFVVVTITDPPYPKYRFDHSTQGTGEEVFIAGYFRWLVDGKPHGDEMTVRRQNQVYLKPDWAEGYSTYPCNGALLTTSELAIPKN